MEASKARTILAIQLLLMPGNRYRIVGDAGGNWTLVNLPILILINSQSFYRPVFLKWCPPCNDICPFCCSYHQRLNRKNCTERVAAEWHTRRVSTSYTRYAVPSHGKIRLRSLIFYRFQVVVLSAYKQIRSHSDNILCDIDEDNYDRAFLFLRPGKVHIIS